MSAEAVVDYPRVLVLAAPALTRTAGTGVTLANLFHGFPPDKVAQIHLDVGSPDDAMCGCSLRLPNNGSPLEGSLRSVGTKLSSRRKSSTTITAARLPVEDARSAMAGAWVSAAFDLLPGHLSRDTVKWARKFNPDLIYSPLGSIRMMKLARGLADRLAIPIAPHLMDAWPHTLFADGEVFGLGRREVRRSLTKIADRSPRLLAISQLMADEFSDELGIPASVFMNCVSDDDLAKALPISHSNESLLFSYVGGLHLDRWRSLLRLAEGLSQTPGSARLQIHAPQAHLNDHGTVFANVNNVDLGPPLAANRVAEALRRADVLVHVESFAPAAQRFTRLSISTKVPQYMAARRPILALGPGNLASMRHIEDASAGVVVSTQAPSALTAAISMLIRDEGLRKTLADRGRAYAEAHHSQAAVARAFACCLSEVATEAPKLD
jgi:glycosyltransferase involved in cell wall biosynthesis